MKRFKQIASYLFIAVVLIGMLGMNSCISQKRIKILQPTDGKENIQTFTPIKQEEYKLGRGDNLYINIRTDDVKKKLTKEMFNSGNTGQTAMGANEISTYLNSYMVDKSGHILVPTVGKVYVEGLTIDQLIALLESKLSKTVIQPVVDVKLLSFRLTFLGEVRQPGKYTVYQSKINILEAFTLAGDIDTYGNRRAIKLLRQNGDKLDMHIINITKEDIIESDYFYLKPNDILYVEPLRQKQFGFETFPYTFVFSTITFVLSMLAYLKISQK